MRKKIDACIELLNIEPTLLLRYVDDIFALFRNESDADTFLNVLNDLHPCLTFTIEKGNKSMPFLDVNVSIDSKSFVTTVYRKETHTGVFLNFYAMAPSAWKRGVIMCLLYRAKMICSSVSLFNTEVGALRDMFFRNSYSSKFFDSVLSTFRRVSDVITPSVTEEPEKEETPTTVILRVPYFGKCSVNFARSLSSIISSHYNVKVNIVYCTFKVKSYFSLKCFSPFYLSSFVVYHFKCMDDSCTDSYVGYTIRHLYARAEEHLKVDGKQQSEVKEHVRKCSACKNACHKDFLVLNRCSSEVHCKLYEAFAIKRMRPTLNKQLFANGMSKILHIWK